MRKKKQRAASNYPPIKPSGFYPIPSVAEIKGLFPPQVRAQGAFHLCTIEAFSKKGYHLQSDYLFGQDKHYKENLCNSINEVRRLVDGDPKLAIIVETFLRYHLRPLYLLTANIAQLLKCSFYPSIN